MPTNVALRGNISSRRVNNLNLQTAQRSERMGRAAELAFQIRDLLHNRVPHVQHLRHQVIQVNVRIARQAVIIYLKAPAATLYDYDRVSTSWPPTRGSSNCATAVMRTVLEIT